MPSNFPPDIADFGDPVVDNVDQVVAAHINDLRDEVIATQTEVLSIQNLEQPGQNLLYSSLTNDATWQEGATFNDPANDSYVADLWNLVWETNAPDITQQSAPSGEDFTKSFRCTFDTNNSRAGIVQFLSSQDSVSLRGKTVSLSAKVWGVAVSNIRMGVIYWVGTPDSITSSIVSAWAATPTLATSWAFANTPASIAIDSTPTYKSIENITIPTTTENLGVFIWTPDSENSGDLFNVANVKLEYGDAATPFVARRLIDEYLKCAYFYQKSFALATAPAQNAGATTSAYAFPAIQAGANVNRPPIYQFSPRMRSAPTITLFNPAAANAQARDITNAVDCSSTAAGVTTESGFLLTTTGNASTTVNARIVIHWTADARL